MKKLLTGVTPFPTDAQNSLLLCALCSVLLYREGDAGTTPFFFCGKQRGPCTGCGDCGDKSDTVKRHGQLYHHYATVSGIGLLWEDPCETIGAGERYHKGTAPTGAADRLDFCLKAAGYDYRLLERETDRQELFQQITGSIERNMPVLMKLGDGPDWCVATGFDREKGILYGLDASKHYAVKPTVAPDGYTEEGLFYSAGWYDRFVCAVLLESAPGNPIGLPELLGRMTAYLGTPDRDELEKRVMETLDSGKTDAATAGWLNNLAGYSVEARWHGAECFLGTLYRMTENETCRDLLGECTSIYLRFHDDCWKIWGLLGVGPATNYILPADAAGRVGKLETRSELKTLFAGLFEYDRRVLGHLWKCLDILRNPLP